jgi:hypothetical protein
MPLFQFDFKSAIENQKQKTNKTRNRKKLFLKLFTKDDHSRYFSYTKHRKIFLLRKSFRKKNWIDDLAERPVFFLLNLNERMVIFSDTFLFYVLHTKIQLTLISVLALVLLFKYSM